MTARHTIVTSNHIHDMNECDCDLGGRTERVWICSHCRDRIVGQQTEETAVLCGSGCCASSNYPVTALLFECVAVLRCRRPVCLADYCRCNRPHWQSASRPPRYTDTTPRHRWLADNQNLQYFSQRDEVSPPSIFNNKVSSEPNCRWNIDVWRPRRPNQVVKMEGGLQVITPHWSHHSTAGSLIICSSSVRPSSPYHNLIFLTTLSFFLLNSLILLTTLGNVSFIILILLVEFSTNVGPPLPPPLVGGN